LFYLFYSKAKLKDLSDLINVLNFGLSSKTLINYSHCWQLAFLLSTVKLIEYAEVQQRALKIQQLRHRDMSLILMAIMVTHFRRFLVYRQMLEIKK
jgi:hypothetical protein|tara:strand:+ start:709 stop:996 length:288 start_codon:yes stop_codon:yes gene_type:complete